MDQESYEPGRHAMVDLETLGTKGNYPVFFALAAVRFHLLDNRVPIELPTEIPCGTKYDHKPSIHYNREVFLAHIDISDAIENGFAIEGDTFMWWQHPDRDNVRRALFDEKQDRCSVDAALIAFKNWYTEEDWYWQHRNVCENVWSHGLNFDVGILERAYKKICLELPWDYRAPRDTRTLFAATEYLKDFDVNKEAHIVEPELPPGFEDHHPLYDAWYQARQVQECYSTLRGLGQMTLTSLRD